MPGPDREKIRKKIIKLFKDNGLNITIDMNLNTANFLDCTLELDKGLFYPYKKDNNVLLYINHDSNHPPCIKKQLPSMIEKRLSDLSSSKEQFDKTKNDYQKALNDSGFKTRLN